MYLKIERSVITLWHGPCMGIQSRFRLWNPVKEFNIRGDIPSKVAEHVEGVLSVTNYVWYNQFSVALILHSIKVYFFTCSYFRILYSVLHLKDSSTSIRVKIRWSTLNLHTWSAPRLRTTTQSSKTQSSVLRSRDEFSRHNDAIIF